MVAPRAVIDAAGDASVFISTISLGELAFGVQSCADAAERARRAAHLRQLERRPVLDV
ncbi:VapC toxin family PIN domain ribonuclease, partial [Burkholderia pseudomallei]|nr:VapC toxin family PIN domain ribonuclease [Burkholderia pseudomallei]